MIKKNIITLAVIPGSYESGLFPFSRRQVDSLNRYKLHTEVFYLSTRTNIIGLVKEFIRFRHTMKILRPDVIHSHYGTVTSLFCVLAKFGTPLVISYRGSDLNPFIDGSYFRYVVSHIFSQISSIFARRIICANDGLKKALWIRGDKVIVIPTGVNENEFFPMDRGGARNSLGWDSSRVILFNYSYSKSSVKRMDLVLEAFHIIKSNMNSVNLVVMKGDVDPCKVPLYINAADCLVVASDYEGSPTIVQEALSCNLPICSVDVGDVSLLVSGVKNCIITDRNAIAIANSILRLIKLPLRSNGREYLFRYGEDNVTQRTKDILIMAAAKD